MFYSNKYLLGAYDIGDAIGPWETKMRRKHPKTWFNWSYQTFKNLICSMVSVYKLYDMQYLKTDGFRSLRGDAFLLRTSGL